MPTIDSRARSIVHSLSAYRPGTSIDEARRVLKRGSVIKLASNENALGSSPKAIAALRAASALLNRYPDSGCMQLRAKLAQKLRVEAASIIVGNGSDELIVLALRAFVDPGDAVVVAQPTFLIYELQARACGALVQVVPLRDYRYDLKAMRSAVSPHTKLVFVANPDNPTGTYVTKNELETFINSLPPETILFMDEAYYEFVDARDYPQTLSVIDNRRVIVTRSFSKAYGLAGLRVGYGISSPEIVAAMNAVREPFNVNTLAQAAAIAALDDAEFLSRTRKMLSQARNYLTRELDKLKVRYVPSVTNFLLIELGPKAPAIAQGLLSEGIIVRDMNAWRLPGCLRVTFGTMSENRRFVKALKQCLK